MRNTMGEYRLVRKDREGYVTRFDIPESYLERTLHAERPLPEKAIAIIRKLWFDSLAKNGYKDPANMKIDMRDAYGNFRTFDEWVHAYQKSGVDFAWADDDDEGRIAGGKGALPDLNTIWHGTHFGGSWFYDKTNLANFIAAMQEAGYVGLEYDGGKRVGQNVRGGGGILHRAYVFWDDNAINGFRIGADRVTGDQEVGGRERGLRNGDKLRRLVGPLAAG